MTILIKGGKIISAAESYVADILVDDEKIVQLGEDIQVQPDFEVFDASGKLIMPGGVDVHTHFDLPMFNTVSSDDHYSGHKAAAFGGTTTVIDFIPLSNDDLVKNVDDWHELVDHKAAVDFGFHMNITSFNETVAKNIPLLLNEGISSLKVFTAYNNRLRIEDVDIFRVMRIAAENGFLTMLHAENGDIIDILVEEALKAGHTSPIWHAKTRPAWGAVEAVARGVSLSAHTGAPLYIVHMNAAGEVDQLQYARDQGLKVMGEACPQYLFFTEDNLLQDDGAKWICSPPMRTYEDNERLWQGLEEGTISTIATDHCPFFYDGTRPIIYEGESVQIPGKELGKNDFTKIPNGLPAVGDRLPVMWTEGVKKGRISANQFVALTATNPSKIFGMYPQKGALLPGSDADIVIWNPDIKISYGVSRARHRTDYNLYEGWQLEGFPEKVFLRGKLIVDSQQWLGKRGEGRFIKRKPSGEII